jgi:hypothetical protein
MPRFLFDGNLLETPQQLDKPLSQPVLTRQRSNVDELCHGPPAWLWSYLRRSKMVCTMFNIKVWTESTIRNLEWILSTSFGRPR